MSAIAHSHMRAPAPEISSNMCVIASKGSLFSILVLSIEFLEFIGAASEQWCSKLLLPLLNLCGTCGAAVLHSTSPRA